MAAKKTDTASEAQGRFVVSLPKDVGTQLDQLITDTAQAMRAQVGVAVEISRSQMVQSLVQTALAAKADAAAAQAAAAAADNGNAADESEAKVI